MSSTAVDTEGCERLDPITAQDDLYAEHVARYLFSRGFAQGKRVLDCATGVGYGAALLADVADWVVGIDNAREAIGEACQRYARANVRYLIGDGRSLPLRGESIDLVVSLETVEHATHPERFIAEFRRVLTPSGVLIVSTPNTDVYRHEDGVDNPFHEHEFTIEELTTLLRRYFPFVNLLAERHQTAVVMGPPACVPMDIWFGDQQRPRPDVLERSPYVVAVCGTRPIQTNGLVRFTSGGSRMHEVVAWARSSEQELERLRAMIGNLQEDVAERTSWATGLEAELARTRELVEERTTWAKDLDAELAPAREVIEERTMWAQDLDAELVRARVLVDERTTWAQNLDAELGRAREIIQDLQAQLEERTAWARSLDAELEMARKRQGHQDQPSSPAWTGHQPDQQ